MEPRTHLPHETGRHQGPSLALLATVHAVLFVGSIVAIALMTHGGRLPSPYDPVSRLNFFIEYADAVRLGAFLQLGAAIVLGLFTAVAVSRLRFLGVGAAGVMIAAFGGFAAAVFGSFAALLAWVLASTQVTLLASAGDGFHWLLFLAGGPAQVAMAGLLVAGVTVSGALAGLLPRWLFGAGAALALVAELSTLMLVVPAAVYLVPIARIVTLVWLIAVGAMLPKSRSAETSAPSEPAPTLRPAHQH